MIKKFLSLLLALCLLLSLLPMSAMAQEGYTVTISNNEIATIQYDVAQSAGPATQTVAAGEAMKDVYFRVDSSQAMWYGFPASYMSGYSQNGVSVQRISPEVVKISGTPTGNVSIALQDVSDKYYYTLIRDGGSGEYGLSSPAQTEIPAAFNGEKVTLTTKAGYVFTKLEIYEGEDELYLNATAEAANKASYEFTMPAGGVTVLYDVKEGTAGNPPANDQTNPPNQPGGGQTPPASSGTLKFVYAYDVQRSPAFPKAGDQFTASYPEMPLIPKGSNSETRRSSAEGIWTLTNLGIYGEVKNSVTPTLTSNYLSGVMSSAASVYGKTADQISLYELKENGTHIAYGVLCAYSAADHVALFIGDLWSSDGAGYCLTIEPMTGDVTTDITDDATDTDTPVPSNPNPNPNPNPGPGPGSGSDITIEHTTNPDGNAMKGDLAMDTDDILDLLVPDSDKQGDKNIKVYLEVRDTGVSDADKSAINSKASGNVAAFLDISLFLQRNSETPEKISNTGKPVTIRLKLDDSMIVDNREYYIIYVHNGQVKTLEAAFDKAAKTLTFEAFEFSSYAIAYKTPKRSDADYDYVPGTGNTTGLGLWTGMLLFGLAVLACTELLRRRKHI